MKRSSFSAYGAALAGAIFAAGIAGGCAAPETIDESQVGHVTMKRPAQVQYEQIPADGCTLEPLGKLEAVAGTPFMLNVLLTNRGLRDLQIKEWYMIDQYNFAVYYRRLPADRPLDPKTPFNCYRVRIPFKPRPNHSELRLAPGNRAELTVELPFTGELAPGEKAEFEVYLATALETFKLRSPTFLVVAR